jgi:hypothetical protein
MDIANIQDPVQIFYYGLKIMRLLITYTPFKDFNVGHFALVKPHDPNFVFL